MKTTRRRACRSARPDAPPSQTYPPATKVTSFRILLNFSNPKGAFCNLVPTAPLSFFSLLVRAREAAPGTLLAKNAPFAAAPEQQNRPSGAPGPIFKDF